MSNFDATTPLAQEVAELSRRRQALAEASFPLPAETRILTVVQPEGRRRQDHDDRQPRRRARQGGAQRARDRPRPPGQRVDGARVPSTGRDPSVYDVIVGDAPMRDAVQKSPEFDGLWCVPATIHLAGAEIELVSLVAREQRLRSALDVFLGEQADEPFHYVFIDCPPSLGLLTINAFVAAKEVLIPIQCEYYALEGLSQLLDNIQLIQRHLNPRLALSTILLTMYDARTNLANQVVDEVREHFPTRCSTTLIPRSVRISEAPSYGQSVHHLRRATRPARSPTARPPARSPGAGTSR